MTEAQWLACTDPDAMLKFVAGTASTRQLRLFACACARRVWHLLPHASLQAALEAAECYVDGQLTTPRRSRCGGKRTKRTAP
jgi:hypothetical protein